MAYLMDRIQAGELNPHHLVSAVVSWRELESVYIDMANRKPGMLTAVLDWSE